ncbi:retrotransposon ORF1 [Tanacetum coccineum]
MISRSAPHLFLSAPVFLESKEGLLISQEVRRTFSKVRPTFLPEPNQNARNSYFAKGLFEMKIPINMDSSMGKMCLGKDVFEVSSDRNEGSRNWDSGEYKDTAGSGEKKPEALVFHKMYTEEDSDRYIAQCFLNGLYASDGEINLEKNDNLISNDYAVKLCLEYEARKGKKLIKKDLMVLLRGEIHFVQFIINPDDDEFEPGLVFGRSFLRSANAIINFGEGTISIQPDFDPFLLSSDEEGKPDLDNLEMLLDFDFDGEQQTETDLPPMVCKIGKGNRNKKKIMDNIMYFNNGAGPSSSVGTPLTQEEAEKRALAHNISMRYEILEEVRPVIETLAYNDKYRKLLDEIWADKVRLEGKINLEEERSMIKVKGHMLKEKKDPMAFIFPIRLEGLINENALADTGSDINTMPYRIYEQLGRDDIMKVDKSITMINYTEAEVTGRLANVLCQVGFTTLSASFLILEIPIDRDAPIIVGRGFLNTIGGNIDVPNRTLTTFDGLTHQTFRAAKSEKIRIAESDSNDEEDYTSGAYDHEAGSSRAKRSRNVETVEEALLPDVHHEFLEWSGCSREAKSHYNTRAFNIREPIYPELCSEFYATYEFVEVCADDKLQSKKIISFRLGGRALNLTLLEFSMRLGLYHADELDEGFDTYFQGGLRSDENFNAREYWERISINRDLYLSRSSITSVRFLILRVLHKMITYRLCQRTNGYEKIQRNDLWLLSMFEDRHQNGYANVAWVIAKWIKRKGAGSQKDSQICYGQFISKIARKSRVLTDETIRTLSTPVYYRDLDRTTLGELIDSEDRLIPKILIDDVLRVITQRALRGQRASMQDLYERMGSMEIRQEAIERMKYKHAYH